MGAPPDGEEDIPTDQDALYYEPGCVFTRSQTNYFQVGTQNVAFWCMKDARTNTKIIILFFGIFVLIHLKHDLQFPLLVSIKGGGHG